VNLVEPETPSKGRTCISSRETIRSSRLLILLLLTMGTLTVWVLGVEAELKMNSTSNSTSISYWSYFLGILILLLSFSTPCIILFMISTLKEKSSSSLVSK
jgi:hypothetical protein